MSRPQSRPPPFVCRSCRKSTEPARNLSKTARGEPRPSRCQNPSRAPKRIHFYSPGRNLLTLPIQSRYAPVLPHRRGVSRMPARPAEPTPAETHAKTPPGGTRESSPAATPRPPGPGLGPRVSPPRRPPPAVLPVRAAAGPAPTNAQRPRPSPWGAPTTLWSRRLGAAVSRNRLAPAPFVCPCCRKRTQSARNLYMAGEHGRYPRRYLWRIKALNNIHFHPLC